MEGIVQYAEDRNVLLVAAVGNESTSVKYPAAYPTVLAVGGVKLRINRLTLARILAQSSISWHLGTYTQQHLAAAISIKMEAQCLRPRLQPQLRLWSGGNTRAMTAYQVRSQLEQTAEDLKSKGWDPKTGYGLLRLRRP